MGNVAASGGYWISCSADKILADPTCITGSIGVLGMIPNMQDFFKNKLGITFDYAQTNENADFLPITKPLPAYQKALIEKEIEKIYNEFLELVAEGRNMTTEQVDEIARGRVWNAVDAKRIGLIDELGGLNDAIELAAKEAGIEDYKLYSLPYQKDPFQQILENFTGQARARFIANELGEDYIYYKYLKQIREMDGIQARLPFEIVIH